MKHQTLEFIAARSDKIAAAAGATLVAIALGMAGAMHPHAARAAAVSTGVTSISPSPMLLPTLQVAAAADTASDAVPEGFRAKMRERMQQRIEEHKKEFEKEHPPIDKKLTHDQVRDIVAGHLAMSGNANLKVGKVAAKEDGIVTVEILTKTGALVDIREISTKTGLPVGMEQRIGAHMGSGRFAGGHGMMHHGFQRGALAASGGDQKAYRDLALTTDQAKKLAEARLIMMGNKNLKVGSVKEKDADTIAIDIVASDNSLVVQRLINRHTGRPIRNS